MRIFFKAESFEAMEQGTVLALDLIAHDPFAAMRIVLDQEAAIDFQITSLDRQNQQVPLGRDNHDVELANVLLATPNGGPWQFVKKIKASGQTAHDLN